MQDVLRRGQLPERHVEHLQPQLPGPGQHGPHGSKYNQTPSHSPQNLSLTYGPQFGKGDGGGGPTWQHLERLRRLRGMADTTGVIPRVHVGATVDQFFDRLEPKADSLVTWYGELYFELHRGVYTTQARTKLHNRRSEMMLHDLELLATIASVQNESYKYPKKELDEMWQGVMLCQFHDCLPGTAIEMCYDDSEKVSTFSLWAGDGTG